MASKFALNPRTQTMESGKYYAGKEKADKRYASGLTQSTSPYTAQGIANRNKLAQNKYTLSNPSPTSVIGQLKAQTEQAAIDQADSELQDELSAANALQAERTAHFANTVAANRPPPGGTIKRGATTIGDATGAGLMRANMRARTDAKRKAAKSKAGLGVTEAIFNRYA